MVWGSLIPKSSIVEDISTMTPMGGPWHNHLRTHSACQTCQIHPMNLETGRHPDVSCSKIHQTLLDPNKLDRDWANNPKTSQNYAGHWLKTS